MSTCPRAVGSTTLVSSSNRLAPVSPAPRVGHAPDGPDHLGNGRRGTGVRAMTLIVARRHRDSLAHFFDVGRQNDSGRKALCGFVCRADELVQLPKLKGLLPCELCIRDAPNEFPGPTSDRDAAGVVPADEENGARTYAVGLRGEFVWHDVPERPVLQFYEGREVVVTECGCISWFSALPWRATSAARTVRLIPVERSRPTAASDRELNPQSASNPGPLPTAFPDAEVAGRFHRPCDGLSSALPSVARGSARRRGTWRSGSPG